MVAGVGPLAEGHLAAERGEPFVPPVLTESRRNPDPGADRPTWATIGAMEAYDYRNCQSLFGYAADVHALSGGICQLCGCGGRKLDFDLWRQMTVEHLIGQSQGGYLQQIREALTVRFPQLEGNVVAELAREIDRANTVTACSFCNSTTSRARAAISMEEAIANAPEESPEEIYRAVTAGLQLVLDDKRREVRWKLDSVRRAFDDLVKPRLGSARKALRSSPQPS